MSAVITYTPSCALLPISYLDFLYTRFTFSHHMTTKRTNTRVRKDVDHGFQAGYEKGNTI